MFETALVTEGWYGSGRREAREMVVKALDCNAYSKVRSPFFDLLSPSAVSERTLT